MRGLTLLLLCVVALPAAADDPVDALIAQLSSPESGRRKAAAEELGRLRDKRAVPALIENLIDESPSVRASAVWALGEIGDPAAAPALARLLSRPVLSAEVVDALVAIGPDSTPVLAKRVKNKETRRDTLEKFAPTAALKWLAAARSWHVRKWAIDTAGRLDKLDAEWISILARAVAEDAAGSVRYEAAEALGLHRIVDPLVGPLRHDKEPAVRRMAAHGMARAKTYTKLHVEALIAALSDPACRVQVARALSRARGHEEVVVKALKKDGSLDAMFALARLGHWDREVILKVVEVARKEGVTPPYPHRRNLRAGGSGLNWRREVHRLLPGPPALRREIERELQRASGEEKLHLIWVLGYMRAIPVALLYDKDPRVRLEAACCQPRLAALPILMKHLGGAGLWDVDDCVRSIGVVALPILLREFDRRYRFKRVVKEKGGIVEESAAIPQALDDLIRSFSKDAVAAAIAKMDGLSKHTKEHFADGSFGALAVRERPLETGR